MQIHLENASLVYRLYLPAVCSQIYGVLSRQSLLSNLPLLCRLNTLLLPLIRVQINNLCLDWAVPTPTPTPTPTPAHTVIPTPARLPLPPHFRRFIVVLLISFVF